MSLYDDIASAILDILPDLELSVGGDNWTVYRGTGTPISVGTRVGYVLRNAVDKRIVAQAGTTIYTADWVLFAELGIDFRVNDIIVSVVDTTRVFNVNGMVTTDLGMILAPLVPTQTVIPAVYTHSGFTSILWPVGL